MKIKKKTFLLELKIIVAIFSSQYNSFIFIWTLIARSMSGGL